MYLKLAWRNIWRNKRRTLITVSSVMFAVVFALFLESLERGAHDVMIDNMTRFHTGYIQVQDYRFEDEPSLDNAFYYDDSLSDQVTGLEPVEYTIPRIETFMLAAGAEVTRGAIVMGIDVDREDQLNDLKDRLTEGRFFEPGDGTAVVTEGLANRLNLAVGDSLVLLGQGRFGMTASGLYEISGLLRHPTREMNNQLVYLSLPDAQWLLSADDHITALLVTPNRVRDTESIARQLRSELENEELAVFTWRELIPELVEALEFDQAQSRLMMGILYVVIGFGIFGTILTMTLERMREFGILLSVGMQRIKLAFVVFIETFFITIMGVLAGYALGIFPILYFYFNPIELGGDMEEVVAEFGIEPIMPTAIAPDIFLWQGLMVFILTTIICLYPTIKILTLKILEASRA
ncbi:ABC transporter permease [Rhodohalobacter sp. SW132]|uniref:ABC transporter permease n=1 Tax=Rhodohalobacter sp. SW132 TaxID=2293433 RepID=UPI000E25ECE9|nr:FtsX-like permease family protein [Rhodohalobacter sp. SW132]REL38951.1 ABC transporter permease [Rhodohalobacter sp. SW132]